MSSNANSPGALATVYCNILSLNNNDIVPVLPPTIESIRQGHITTAQATAVVVSSNRLQFVWPYLARCIAGGAFCWFAGPTFVQYPERQSHPFAQSLSSGRLWRPSGSAQHWRITVRNVLL